MSPGPVDGTWAVTVAAVDRPELLARIAGAMALAGLDILALDAYGSSGSVALDTFMVSSATRRPVSTDTFVTFERLLRAALKDRLELQTRLTERRAHYPARGADPSASRSCPAGWDTAVLVSAPDQTRPAPRPRSGGLLGGTGHPLGECHDRGRRRTRHVPRRRTGWRTGRRPGSPRSPRHAPPGGAVIPRERARAGTKCAWIDDRTLRSVNSGERGFPPHLRTCGHSATDGDSLSAPESDFHLTRKYLWPIRQV